MDLEEENTVQRCVTLVNKKKKKNRHFQDFDYYILSKWLPGKVSGHSHGGLKVFVPSDGA